MLICPSSVLSISPLAFLTHFTLISSCSVSSPFPVFPLVYVSIYPPWHSLCTTPEPSVHWIPDALLCPLFLCVYIPDSPLSPVFGPWTPSAWPEIKHVGTACLDPPVSSCWVYSCVCVSVCWCSHGSPPLLQDTRGRLRPPPPRWWRIFKILLTR